MEIHLRDTSGRSIEGGTGFMTNPDTYFPLPLDDESYSHLRFVDQQGTTTFNSFQMGGVIPELERLLETHRDEVDAAMGENTLIRAERQVRMIEEALALAQRCRSEPGTFLVFAGE